jgi:uncharacterized protein
MTLSIVPFYGAILALIYVLFSVRVMRMRQRSHVMIGSGGDIRLERAIRVHANFAEYVPLTLLLLAFGELQGAPAWLLHLLCLVLLVGRLAIARGVSQEPDDLRLRGGGIVLTIVALAAASISLLLGALGI